MLRRRETKAVVRGGAYRRSLLGVAVGQTSGVVMPSNCERDLRADERVRDRPPASAVSAKPI
jgi:hypothetical protein